jgi:Holliday junction resolvase RusA-like endonuclease
MIQLTIPGEPIAQPRQRHMIRYKANKQPYIVNYMPERHPVHAYKQAIALLAKQQCREPIDGPVELSIDFFYNRPKSIKGGVMLKATREDLDNLAKAVLDALNGIAYPDDGRVFRLHAAKYYCEPGTEPRTEIAIERY